MGVVVLLGSHTAGKSSAVRRLQQNHGHTSTFIDTDAEIANDFNGNLYNIFLALTEANNTKMAANLIEQRERALLRQLRLLKTPCIISAGPLIPTREPEWTEFLEAVRPTCFFFKLSAKEMFDGLKLRRSRQKRNSMDTAPNFGSWDKNLATYYDESKTQWLELSEAEALPLLESFLGQVNPIYEQACESFRIYQAANIKIDKSLQADLEEAFLYYLSKEPIATAQSRSSSPIALDFRPVPKPSLQTILALLPGSVSSLPKKPEWLQNIEWELNTNVPTTLGV